MARRAYLTWDTGSGDSHQIYRESNPDGTEDKPAFPSGYTQIDTVGIGVSEYDDKNCPEESIVYYAIVAEESGNISEEAVSPAGLETQDTPNTLSVTTGDVKSAGNSDADFEITLDSFDSSTYDAANLFVQYREQGNATWTDKYSITLTSSPHTITASIFNLDPGETYEYRAAANNYSVDISTNSPASKDTSQATLEGDVTTIDGPSDIDVWFQWREAGNTSFNDTSKQTVSTTGTYSQTVTGLTESTDYEYRAIYETSTSPDSFGGIGSLVSFTTDSSAAEIDSFESDRSGAYSRDTNYFSRVDASGEPVSARQGSYILKTASTASNAWMYSGSGDGLPNYFAKGETAQIWINVTGEDSQVAALFGVGPNGPINDGFYSAEIVRDSGIEDMIQMQKYNGSYSTIANSSRNVNITGWHKIIIERGSSDTITMTLEDANGNQVYQISGTDTEFDSWDGVGYWNSAADADAYFDYYHKP